MQKQLRQLAKRPNKALILREIYERGQVSRADLARLTGLTRPTVSAIVAKLLKGGLVMEAGVGQSTGGKRPVLLTVRADACHLLCVDVGNQQFRGAVVDVYGKIVSRYALPAADLRGEAALAHMFDLIDALRTRTNRPILGIAIGTPGVVNPHDGIVQRAINLDWHDVPLRRRLVERYGVPVHVANDSHVAALAEFMHGDGRNVILLKTGQGIGAGIVWNGAMLSGDGFGAGEVGQLVLAEQNGRRLTLEQLAGTQAVLARARALISADISWPELISSPKAAPIVQTVGHYLGLTVANLIATLNIHQIVIAGRLIQFGDPLLDHIRTAANDRVLTTMLDQTTIRFSNLGDDIVMLGCSALLLKRELGVL